MVNKLLSKIFGSRNDRLVKKMRKRVEQINALEAQFEQLSDAQLQDKTAEFRQRLAAGTPLDELLPEAFAAVREAGKRVMEMRHYDVQCIGGMVLNDGKIAEMKTGEGKTLVATLAAYLNALPARGVHVVTVNDYLAKRDAEWMGKIYNYLGLTVGVVVAGLTHAEKKAAYAADITYGTNNEFGFDYLRDNMAFHSEDRVQRDLAFAIVDEVDSILIDEARTPLIISGPAEDSSALYAKINTLVPHLTRHEGEERDEEKNYLPMEQLGDYMVDEKSRQVHLTEAGHQHVEEMLIAEGLLAEHESLYDSANIGLLHHFNAALRAHALYQRDVHYIVRNGEVVIVDEFTGRTMPGRRWSDGLHQAVEAKEGVRIQNENQTLASITFQNYFRLYDKLSGMTGTADTEAYEFQSIYGLEVVVIPSHRPVQRLDHGDLVYLSTREKFVAIVEDIKGCMQRQQPVLVGTASIESSELLSKALNEAGIAHEVLNAKQHEREATIVANAGMPGAVTIATNMAGRGTDIVLGGNIKGELERLEGTEREAALAAWRARHQQVLEAGGLHIIGTERNESRRIDNQLRGRSGRQGDPGSSRFYLSLEDTLMRIFASERVTNIMQRLGMAEGESIEHVLVTRAIENAQRKVEGHNFEIRKNLLEYDDVANDQRKVIYEQRNELMASDDLLGHVEVIVEDVLDSRISAFIPPQSIEEMWDVEGLEMMLVEEFGQTLPVRQWLDSEDDLYEESLRKRIIDTVWGSYREKENLAGAENLRHFEKVVMLQTLDSLWKEHLAAMDYLRQGIGLRGYAQKNPKQEYKREAYELFTQMLGRYKQDIASILCKVPVVAQSDVEAAEARRAEQEAAEMQNISFHHEETTAYGDEPAGEMPEGDEAGSSTYVREERKVGRNEPCPCGSGKKYKQCHGRLS